MNKLTQIWRRAVDYFLPGRRAQTVMVCLLGAGVGLSAYIIYMSKAYSYLSDKPEVCINCHVMAPYYATWSHGSHARVTNCNDCHVPHNNIFNKYKFKAMDGLRHSYVFTMRNEPQVMQAIAESREVIYQNCVRCHAQLNQEFVHTGHLTPHEIATESDRACWDCHREVPHGGKNSLSATPTAVVPFPTSPIPKWLQKQLKEKE